MRPVFEVFSNPRKALLSHLPLILSGELMAGLQSSLLLSLSNSFLLNTYYQHFVIFKGAPRPGLAHTLKRSISSKTASDLSVSMACCCF